MKITKETIFAIVDFETSGVNMIKDFPIEIGIVYCDANLKIIEEYSSLILWEFMEKWDDWQPSHYSAFKIHNIPLKDIQKFGKSTPKICNDIWRFKHFHSFGKNMILISDNPYFEMSMMIKLMKHVNGDLSNLPFHYNAYSTNPLISMNNKNYDSNEKPHRALDDCKFLHNHLIHAWNINNFWIE